jgi:hypothetical protein
LRQRLSARHPLRGHHRRVRRFRDQGRGDPRSSLRKVAVKQVAFVHDGKFDEANKLSTKEMQDQWKAMPAKDKTEMSDLAKAMSPTQEQFTAQVKAGGVLVVDAGSATLTTKTTTKDANGSSTETTTQKFTLNGSECLVSR